MAMHFFTSAESAFADGNYPVALDEALAGLNNLTTGVGNDLVDGRLRFSGPRQCLTATPVMLWTP